MARLKHELWREPEEEETFCLAGPDGDAARARMSPGAVLVWTVWATSHFEAMTRYYVHRGWGRYTTSHEWDLQPYPEEWLQRQREAGVV
ncbi:MAG TPA: hypothetical protein VF701_15800 [Thermoanaerobaculia bacterium]